MSSIEERLIKPKLGLLDLAKQLGSVSQACKVMGYSRDSFHRFREFYERSGFYRFIVQEADPKEPCSRTCQKGGCRFGD